MLCKERLLHAVTTGLENRYLALSENSVVGPRGNVSSPGKDGEAGDIGFIVDAAGCSQAENKPLEARSSFPTEPNPAPRTPVLSFHTLQPA